ncbi:tRNA (5-methylaminomethyl-2-thiouridine)(34)-methyltransferase MnmD [Arcobacter porcinus]|uniref:Bifunctional tRNA (Mnm(5)s(2)U34)-methyltransferase/FAD-dependent cmnm(5)s(2)U34 oxidoreductase n=1 Tax=Arcobacter porcinus TaxID=1935204 RepID=A0ABX2YB94_9BACT|nr:MnmC family methyltransferase [Arcobacter porcinus]OCL84122.1 bifunctional tRNA (mnm(5)s(2)U34)-methyltransferase/FAD-dependent cmnm(5)s(2)U34 oxidoreductase [Arcobacter porcinus]OCL84646.1 bifunctional tRNA (mnm(5)s(2)U34)-methyltransferase/FAD-dependent cmnm(5)s(2)U34 oxidoreductase [Arcobacter porcinus]OCL89186.1 bifunctional tRNA (mnm(5)s(2)U34)-methyltransferase/FAD-dependent cmnm(5)s(2)U34 oxidoreductase [Arcobacter porcinus]OCL91606.1 bifunctional tRNA (mnm(5)s(2)U34)-methyltransferas
MENNQNILVFTEDGSNTLYSNKYNQHFHNTKDGAINEALHKHIIPAFTHHKDKKELNILDICFGIGYNTFSTIYYILKNNLDIKINIFSPELDESLVYSLKDFPFPQEFEEIKHIINNISKYQKYEDDNLKIELVFQDARKYINSFETNYFDIVFQDAFSSEVNYELWTKEYFEDIYKICKEDCILTTYAIATPIRLSMYEAGFRIYQDKALNKKITLGFKKEQNSLGKIVDMEWKKVVNKELKALYD